MLTKIVCILGLALAASGSPQLGLEHNLPVLFQFSQPTHNVAVFRGAALKNAIASGLVKGFGGLGAADGADRDGRSDGGDADSDAGASSYAVPLPPPPPVYTTPAPPPPPPPTLPPPPPTTIAPVTYRPAPQVYRPAPLVYRPAPLVYRPAPAPIVYRPAPAPLVYRPAPAPIVYKPAPAPIVYKPAPAPIVYKPAPAPAYSVAPYVEPAYAQDAHYTWEYSVLDDYTANNFGAKESRDGYLTNGKYYVSLPDGRLQTVTYVVDGDLGYVPIVEYSGEARYAAL